jgi:hypothetical protein
MNTAKKVYTSDLNGVVHVDVPVGAPGKQVEILVVWHELGASTAEGPSDGSVEDLIGLLEDVDDLQRPPQASSISTSTTTSTSTRRGTRQGVKAVAISALTSASPSRSTLACHPHVEVFSCPARSQPTVGPGESAVPDGSRRQRLGMLGRRHPLRHGRRRRICGCGQCLGGPARSA